MGSSVSKYHYNQAHAIIHDELLPFTLSAVMLSDPRQVGREGKPGPMIKNLCISTGVSNPK